MKSKGNRSLAVPPAVSIAGMLDETRKADMMAVKILWVQMLKS
jgi:hypothetical protein